MLKLNGVATEGGLAYGRVAEPDGVVYECVSAVGSIAATDVVDKGECSSGGVVDSAGVGQQRSRTDRRVLLRGGGKECSSADSGVEVAYDVASERKEANCRVESAAGKAEKRILSFSRVAAGITAIRRRIHRVRFWQGHRANN
jgi:hypothetical protein